MFFEEQCLLKLLGYGCEIDVEGAIKGLVSLQESHSAERELALYLLSFLEKHSILVTDLPFSPQQKLEKDLAESGWDFGGEGTAIGNYCPIDEMFDFLGVVEGKLVMISETRSRLKL